MKFKIKTKFYIGQIIYYSRIINTGIEIEKDEIRSFTITYDSFLKKTTISYILSNTPNIRDEEELFSSSKSLIKNFVKNSITMVE